jgi:hypothetical protein
MTNVERRMKTLPPFSILHSTLDIRHSTFVIPGAHELRRARPMNFDGGATAKAK